MRYNKLGEPNFNKPTKGEIDDLVKFMKTSGVDINKELNNMSKETLLKEFDKISDMDREIAREFLSDAIDQTREEMIRNMEEILPKENHKEEDAGTDWSNSGDVHSLGFEIGYNECIKEIKQSLINLNKK